VKGLGSVSPERRRWRRSLRAGLFWTALGLGAGTISYACDPRLAAQSLGFDDLGANFFFALVPIPALALGIRGLALALRLGKASDLAERTAAQLAARLPESFVVVPHYRPRDNGEDEIGIIVLGPPGVVVVEARDDAGEVHCFEDHWYGTRTYGVGRRLPGGSPSQHARRDAVRVRRDVATGGFPRTDVRAIVLFTRAHVTDSVASSVPAFAGIDAVVNHLVGEPNDTSADRTRALANALVGPVQLIAV
jgi:hypothetical protein